MSVAATHRLALFGKLPARGDFVHAGHREADERMFEDWLSRMVEQARGELPEGPVRFLLAFEPGAQLLGTWVASCDASGRAFPFTMTLRSAEWLNEIAWSVHLPLYTPYLEVGAACLAEAQTWSLADAYERAATLTTPHPSAVPAAVAEARDTLTRESARDFSRRVLGGHAEAQLAYALHALQRACDHHAGELTLDMPCEDDFDLFVWCEFLRVHGGRCTPPVALLFAPAARRAFACLTRADAELLALLVNPAHATSRCWPLSTARNEARRNAEAQLGPVVRDALSRDVSLAEVLAALEARSDV